MDALPDRVIFQTREWLDFVARTQRAEPVVAAARDGGETVGFFTGLIVRRYGMRLLGSPLPGWSTLYMGFNLAEGLDRGAAAQALVDFAFRSLGCVHLEIRDRRLDANYTAMERGFQPQPFYTFEVDLRPPEEEIWGRFKSSCRGKIRKAERLGVVVEEADPEGFAEEFHAQLEDVFAKQSLVPTFGVGRVRELIRSLHPTGRLLLARARGPEGRSIATGIFPAMNGTAYFWGGASWRQYQHLSPNEALFWYAMRYWKARGVMTLDMGGGGEYKRKYTPVQVQVPSFTTSRFRALSAGRNLARRAFALRQRALGRMRGHRATPHPDTGA